MWWIIFRFSCISENDNKCFQYAVTVVLNYEDIETHSERITKIEPVINKYNWEEIHFLSEKDDWKKIEKNGGTSVLNVLYTEKKYISFYVSKHNSNCGKQVILNIPKEEEWHFLAVKKSSLL